MHHQANEQMNVILNSLTRTCTTKPKASRQPTGKATEPMNGTRDITKRLNHHQML